MFGLIVALTFDYMTKFFSYWYVRHIPYKTAIPFLGGYYHRILGLRSHTDEVNTLYKQHPKEHLVGSIKIRVPDLIVKSPDLVKEVLSTEFENFKSRGLDLDKSGDICLRNNLFYADGEKWAVLRKGLESILSGMKFEDDLFECLSGTNGNTNVQQLLTKVLDDIFQKLLLRDSDRETVKELREKIQRYSVFDRFIFFVKNVFPDIYLWFGFIINIALQPSFTDEIRSIRGSILEKKIATTFNLDDKRNSGKLKTKPEDLTFGIVATFVSEGYIPCLNTLTALLFELAKSPKVQQKSRNSDEYLDAVIKETLRLHPPYAVITRKCVNMYKFLDSKIVLDRNVTVNVPVEAIHNDNSFYKDADIFNPQRFLDDSPMQSYAYLPFGAGPRKCVGK